MFKRKKTALVTYFSKTGHTRQAADAVARGLESAGVKAVVKSLSEVGREEIGGYNILAVGSPTRGGNPARAVKRFLKGLGRKAPKGATAAGFAPTPGCGEAHRQGPAQDAKSAAPARLVRECR